MSIVASAPQPDPDPVSLVEPTVEEIAGGTAEDAPWRTLEYFATTRVIVASALVLGAAAFGFRSLASAGAPQFGLLLTLGYFVAAALFAGLSLYFHRRFLLQAFAQLALDLGAVTALVIAGGGVASGWVILYLLPLVGASMLLTSIQVFFVCSIAVLAILVDAGLRALGPESGESLLFQTGLFGAALFALSALLRALSARLASQERLARSRGRDLQNQLAINRLVIAQMDQGVIVVDRGGRVRANNRAARRMQYQQVASPADVGVAVHLSATEPGGVTGVQATSYGDYKVIRRNGAVVAFEPSKIAVAMTKAFIAVRGGQGAASAAIREQVEKLTSGVVSALMRRQPAGGTFHIEDVQDQVELSLMRDGAHDVARSYVLYRERRAQERAAARSAQPEAGAASLTMVEAGRRVPLDM